MNNENKFLALMAILAVLSLATTIETFNLSRQLSNANNKAQIVNSALISPVASSSATPSSSPSATPKLKVK